MEMSGSGGGGGGEAGERRKGKHKGKHDKPKPWDEDPNIDHWKVEKFDPSWNEGGMLEVSSFSTLFPQYRGMYPKRIPHSSPAAILCFPFSAFHQVPLSCAFLSPQKYLQEVWPIVKRALHEYGVSCELNLVEGSMTVSTTRKTHDPYIIVKARDLIKLLSRSVPAPQAIKILNDEMQCDIIKIGNLTRNKERFVKRRQRLIGPNSSTLKAIEILTGCYVLVQGNTVAAMGSFKGLKQLRKIVEDCIQNVQHPIYHIKTLLMKRELAKNPALANENWDRFLPNFKKKNVKQKKVKAKEKKPYTPFPPPQQPSKIDLQLESGEYFLSDKKKLAKTWQEKQEKQAQKTAENKRKREAAFVPPKESFKDAFESNKSGDNNNDVIELTTSLKLAAWVLVQHLKKAKEFRKHVDHENINPEAYIAESGSQPARKRSKKNRS
ncbi:hypothetical protein Taro_003636 [Colocasia esculenta]|uniref:KRR-R motif-containing protein 1 n=1 Tax=Colocasia esculenta TaxID=4460 RepID=A0A843TMP0_COLES|nr:hypothetical protein [Colocasia esculenta]